MSLMKLLHVLSSGLFVGAQVTMLALQGYLARSLDAQEQKVLARAAATAGRLVVMPVMYLALVSGVVFWGATYGFRGPPYVHVMLLLGVLSVGAAQVWKKRARLLAEALGRGENWSESKDHLEKGTRAAFLAAGLLVITYAVAVLKVPVGRG